MKLSIFLHRDRATPSQEVRMEGSVRCIKNNLKLGIGITVYLIRIGTHRQEERVSAVDVVSPSYGHFLCFAHARPHHKPQLTRLIQYVVRIRLV
jgi:hypothetical protein